MLVFFLIKTMFRSIQMCSIFFLLFAFGLYGHIYDYETPTAKYLRNIEISELDSGMPGIDCIYVVNLDARPRKWAVMQDILHGFNLRANRISAVNGWALSKAERDELLGSYRNKSSMNGGHIGCLLSHISIMKDAYNRGFQKIWILEDDTRFNEAPYILPDLLDELNRLDPDWDVFYTDTDVFHPSRKITRNSAPPYFRPDQKYPLGSFYTRRWQVSPNIFRIRYRYGTYSMLISKKGIEKLLYHFTHTYIYSPIDRDMHHVPYIKEYCYTREMTYPDMEISDTCKPIVKENP